MATWRPMVAVLHQHGIERHHVEQRGTHPHLVFQIGNRKMRIPFPGSPSDHRGLKAAAVGLRRLLRNASTEANP